MTNEFGCLGNIFLLLFMIYLGNVLILCEFDILGITASVQRNNRISKNVLVWNADSTYSSSKMPLTGPLHICEPLSANSSSASGTITKSTIICHLAPLSFTNLSPVPLPADLVNLSQYSLSRGNVLRFSPIFTGTFYTYFSLVRLVITEETGGSFVSFLSFLKLSMQIWVLSP